MVVKGSLRMVRAVAAAEVLRQVKANRVRPVVSQSSWRRSDGLAVSWRAAGRRVWLRICCSGGIGGRPRSEPGGLEELDVAV